MRSQILPRGRIAPRSASRPEGPMEKEAMQNRRKPFVIDAAPAAGAVGGSSFHSEPSPGATTLWNRCLSLERSGYSGVWPGHSHIHNSNSF